jgi:ABC-type transporter Mla MlaB component
MAETEEIVQTIERLQGALENLAVRGLRSAGPQDQATLHALREEFERIGAAHLAERVTAVITAIEQDDRGAAAALLRAQASLRVFERVLTLEVAAETLRGLTQAADGEGPA